MGAEDGDDFREEILADEATRDGFTLFWETMAGLEVKAFLASKSET